MSNKIKLTDFDMQSLKDLWAISDQLLTNGRAYPLTKTEVSGIIDRKSFKVLLKNGIIQVRHIALIGKDQKNRGTRACVVFTTIGRDYCKDFGSFQVI